MKFSDLITKPVISLYDNRVEGMVVSAFFNQNGNKINSLLVEGVIDDEMFDDYVLDVKDIYSVGQDAIVIKNNFCLKCSNINDENTYCPINACVYTTGGTLQGKVKDLILDENFCVDKLVLESAEIDIKCVAGIKQGMVLVQEDGKQINISKFKHKAQKVHIVSQDSKAIIMPLYDFSKSEQKTEEDKKGDEPQVQVVYVPQKSINSDNILGKIITQNIVATNGELIASKGSVVTQNTVKLASMHQKLRELSFYVR